MAKRTIEEVVADETSITPVEGISRKKSRKDKSKKSKNSEAEQPTNGDLVNHAQNPPRTEEIDADGSKGQVDAEGLSKAERKAAKQARREAKEARKAKKARPGTSKSDTPATDDNEDKEAVKAAKKAAKKAVKKAEKKAEKERLKAMVKKAAEYDSDTASEEEGNSATASPKETSVSTSAVASRLETPVTGSDSAAKRDGPPSLSYTEHPELAALPQAEIDAFLSTNMVTIEDPLPSSRKYRPITKFSYLPITDESQRAPFAAFSTPTPIQAATWPALFAGRDMIGVAETGSGKTFAFGVPCVRFISSLPKKQQKGVKAIIVSPTRELASQIHEQLVKLATPAGLHTVCVYGGVPKDPQILALRKAHIVVATPGRLNDLISDHSADLSKAEFVVLDEADRMLDKGFEEAIRQIIQCTPKQRQTLMFTATWPPSVRELAATFMQSPVKVNIGDNNSGELRANTRIKQEVEVVEPRDKDYRLQQLLRQYQSGSNKDDRILVFCLYKKEATRVEESLRRKGFRVGGIHGDMSQAMRTASLDAFKQGSIPILVATDVAARGLDIPAVKVVINVTFPLTVEDYVHRIGRTGRAGKEGLAITMFTEHDKAYSGALINVLKAANQPVPEELMKFGTTVKKKGHDAYGAHFKNVDTTKKASKITFD